MVAMLDGMQRLAERARVELERLGRLSGMWSPGAWSPSETPETRWATPNEHVPLGDTVSLRVFRPDAAPGDGEGETALVVTSQVNHSYLADFREDQSLVRTLLAAGFARVGVTDWAAPPRHRPYTISDSIDDVERAVDTLGGSAHLVGLCQGGWQSAILAAQRPDKVRSLTVAASPIDTYAGASALHALVFGLPMAFFTGLVAAGGGNAPSGLLSTDFDPLRPFERLVKSAAGPLKLDGDALWQRYERLRDGYRLSRDVAGVLYLETVRDLFRDNKLYRGELVVRDEPVDLSALRCPLQLVAGRRDPITPKEQVFALAELAPEAPSRTWLVDAGHIGVFMGRTSLNETWPKIAAELLGREA